ncbi:MAG: glycosyltransferase [Planctomycetales bacterium]|nr:glycosyltransferase [Planctomycetales bacterium]
MRFLFVVSGKSVPSTRFRILPYLPFLEDAGHTCDVAYSRPPKYEYYRALGWRLSQRLQRWVREWHVLLARRRHYDAIVIEREVFDGDNWEIEAKLRQATGRLVLDVDDGVFLLHPDKFDRIARMCDVAIGGNRWLTEYLAQRCSAVQLIPTCVTLGDYPLREAALQRLQEPRIGWIGTTQNVSLLQVAAPAIRAMAKDRELRLLVVAPSPERLDEVDLRGVRVDFRVWNPRTEVEQLRDMDLGIMPLPAGEEWMKYKCGLKLIQYLAVGIPGVASPIGVNEAILQGDRVGRAATTSAEWEAALAALLDSVPLRQQMGAAGRQLVEQEYSIEGRWQQLQGILTGQLS